MHWKSLILCVAILLAAEHYQICQDWGRWAGNANAGLIGLMTSISSRMKDKN